MTSNGDAWGKGLRLFVKENWLIITVLIMGAGAALNVQARFSQMELTWQQRFSAAQQETQRSLANIEQDVAYIKGKIEHTNEP